jgi:hypothetical protein
VAATQCIVIEVTLIDSRGGLGSAGQPALFCRYSAAHASGTSTNQGSINVVVRDNWTEEWREYARGTTYEEAQAVAAHLEALGVPGRRPDVEAVLDTSDGWTHLLVRVRSMDRTTTFEVGGYSSGFEGPDAERLRELFRYLFGLAGFRDYCLPFYGR